MRFRGAAGSFTPIRGWRHNGDPRVAPLRRSSAGAYTPIFAWLLYADHRLAPMQRSLTCGTRELFSGPLDLPLVGGGNVASSADSHGPYLHLCDRPTRRRPVFKG